MDKSIKNLLNGGDLSDITTYQAGAAQAAVHRSLQKHCDEILMPYGISKMQWLVIGTVLDERITGIRITDLARKLGTTLPYMTNTLNILEAKGFLSRIGNGNDNRSKLVSINSGFVPKCAEIERTLRQKLRESVYARVTPADFRAYMKVLYQLAEIDR